MPDSAANAISQVDRDLAWAALEKRRAGLRPSRDEARALRRIEQAREEDLRWQHYHSIPKRHWREMSGRQAKVLNEQAHRYGLPIGGRTIDLPAFVAALHDFLAANARKLAAGDDDDPALAGASSPNLERKRGEDWRMARLRRRILEHSYLPQATVHDLLARLAARIRHAGEALQRQFGPAALTILNDALTDAETEIANLDPGDPHDGDDVDQHA